MVLEALVGNQFFNKNLSFSIQPWWLGSLERVSNSSRHSLAIGGSNSGVDRMMDTMNKKVVPLYRAPLSVTTAKTLNSAKKEIRKFCKTLPI